MIIGTVIMDKEASKMNSKRNRWLSSKIWGYTAAAVLLPYAVLKTLWAFGIALGWSVKGVSELHISMKSGSPVIYLLYSNGIDITALLACIASLLGLSLVQSWGRKMNRRLILFPAWLGGVAFTYIGSTGLYLLRHAEIGDMHLWVFIPVYGGFLLWGITTILAAVSFQYRTKKN
ncbi:hypothetical protein GC102_37525 [Paenibacillus sp. LMG 31460]|uniref:DUF3995 domain-containing protein n=1 Tax=Paenibacillus germinis TaxID=2654979 RepID=A0ABX1ZGM9_9BACL|nr:hypothetical protein [Paenibacillus germinis]NOU91386.1 hypothetical protein [Paenibacillus germinis]